MEQYRLNREDNSKDSVVYELQNSASRVHDSNDSAYNVDNCECPSCLCHKAKFLLVLAPAGISAATPVMVVAVAAEIAGR